MVEDKYPGINRRYAIWMNWVGLPADYEKVADHSTVNMCLARRGSVDTDYAGIYSNWVELRLSDWVHALSDFEHCDKTYCHTCIVLALEASHGGVKGDTLFDDWLEAWCRTHECPVRFVNYKKEMEEFEREYEEEEKAWQARRLR